MFYFQGGGRAKIDEANRFTEITGYPSFDDVHNKSTQNDGLSSFSRFVKDCIDEFYRSKLDIGWSDGLQNNGLSYLNGRIRYTNSGMDFKIIDFHHFMDELCTQERGLD